MSNVLLGKVIKAMYKLSGKTITQLADETGLTVDTLNNLFYARLQKPGFFGVQNVVEATGYTVDDLICFMETAEKLPADADITEEFTKYIFTAKDTPHVVQSAEPCVQSTEDCGNRSCCMQINKVNEEHEKQLDRFRETHLHYVGELHARYQEQIRQMEQSTERLKQHYDHSVGEIKKSHQSEIDRYTAEIRHAQSLNRWLTVALIAVVAAAVVIAFLGLAGLAG